MDATLHALGGLLLRSVPTFLLIVLLTFYLKGVFFRPLERILKQRYDATAGARKMAEEAMRRADEKAAEYEAAIRNARAEIYRQQEQLHKELHEKSAAEVAAARQSADAAIRGAKEQLSRDVEVARQTLDRESGALADRISESILRGSAA